MVCKVGMSLYCIQILHAKLGSFENEKEKKKEKKNCGLGFFWVGFFCFGLVCFGFFPLVAFVETKGWDVVVTHTHIHTHILPLTHAPTQLHTKEGEWEHLGFFWCVLLNLIRNCAFYCSKENKKKIRGK